MAWGVVMGAVVCLGLAGCGRLGFDPAGGAGPDAGDPGSPVDADVSEVTGAYRVVTVETADPNFFKTTIGCSNITWNVDSTLQGNVDDLQTNVVLVTRSDETFDLVTDADCIDDSGTPTCRVGGSTVIASTTMTHVTAGPCYEAPSTTLGNYGTPNAPTAPCFQTAPVDALARLHSIEIPFERVVVSGLEPDASGEVGTGVIAGFVREAEAMAAEFDDTATGIGGDSLYSILSAGGGPGSSCSNRDDRDESGTGFMFFFNITARAVTWEPG